MSRMIKIFDPVVSKQEVNAAKKVIGSHNWALGDGNGLVLDFEKQFKKYVNSNECIAVDSGTSALHLALSLFDIKNKEVILPSLSYVSMAHAVVYNGGKPIFVDIDPTTLCIDPDSIRKSLSNKTKVILPVHFAGLPSNINEIINICNESNICLVEDAAHAAGAKYKNKKIGSHGTAVCFSFHPIKNLAMPKGGAITLNGKKSKKFKKILQSSRWCGIYNKTKTKYSVNHLGWNYYMNEISAAIGLEQLKKLDRMNSKRRKIINRYQNEINSDFKMPFNKDCSYNFYWLLVNNRNNFMKKMKGKNIETGSYHTPIHKLGFYKIKNKLLHTENISKRLLCIPTHPNLASSDVDKIIKSVNKFL